MQQRELALDYIRAAAIAEVQEHKDVPIRFDFSELPDDLAQAMRDVVGEGNPDFVFVQTDMDADVWVYALLGGSRLGQWWLAESTFIYHLRPARVAT